VWTSSQPPTNYNQPTTNQPTTNQPTTDHNQPTMTTNFKRKGNVSHAAAIFVNGLPGAGKTYSVVGMVEATPWAAWTCVSVGPPGSGSTIETKDWPLQTQGKKKGQPKHAVKRAATLSACLPVAIIGDCVNGKTGISIGFEAPGAFRAPIVRNGVLPHVIRALYESGKVQLLITEALLLAPAAVQEIEKKTSPSTRRLIELTTDPELCMKRFCDRKNTLKILPGNHSVEAHARKHKNAHAKIHRTPVLDMSSSLAKKYLIDNVNRLRSKECGGQ
jgi:hypothetical protein